jgi:hypothetical protein
MRADLRALTPATLAELTNRGLVKRALRETERATPAIAEDADTTVHATYEDGVTTALPVGGLEKGSCSCGAPGVCRHIVGLVLAYQRVTDQLGHSDVAPSNVADQDDGSGFGALGAGASDGGGPGAGAVGAGRGGAGGAIAGGPDVDGSDFVVLGASASGAGRGGAPGADAGGPNAVSREAGGPGAVGGEAGGPEAGRRQAGGPGAGSREAGGPEAGRRQAGGPGAESREAGGPGVVGREAGGPSVVPSGAGGPDAGRPNLHHAKADDLARGGPDLGNPEPNGSDTDRTDPLSHSRPPLPNRVGHPHPSDEDPPIEPERLSAPADSSLPTEMPVSRHKKAGGATPAEPEWSPGEFTDAQLVERIGERMMAAARRVKRTGYVAHVHRARRGDPVSTVELPTATVRFLVPRDLGFARTDAIAGVRDDVLALAVWAFREADACSPDECDVQVQVGGSGAAAGGPALDAAVALAGVVLREGAVHVGAGISAEVTAVRRALEAARMRWPLLAVDDLVTQLEAYRNRGARYRPEVLADHVAEIYARHRAVTSATTDPTTNAHPAPPISPGVVSVAKFDAAPETGIGIAPEARTDAAREASVDVAPGAGADAAREAGADAAPGVGTDAALEAGVGTEPQISPDAAPPTGLGGVTVSKSQAALGRSADSAYAASTSAAPKANAAAEPNTQPGTRPEHLGKTEPQTPRPHPTIPGRRALRSRVLGTDEASETPLRRARLDGLGARVSAVGGERVVEVFLAHAASATVLVLRRSYETEDTGPQLAGRKVAGVSVGALAGGAVVTESAARSASRAVRLGTRRLSRTEAMTSRGAWQDLPRALIADDLAALADELDALPPRPVRARVEAELVRVLPVAEVHSVSYSPGAQRLDAIVADATGNTAVVSASHVACAPGRLDSMAAALRGDLRYVSGTVRRAGGGIVIDPIGFALDGSVVVPDLAAADRGTDPDDALDVATDALGLALDEAATLLAQLAHGGLQHAPATMPDRLRTAARRLRGAGLRRVGQTVETLAGRLGPDPGDTAAEAWVDAYLRVNLAADMR